MQKIEKHYLIDLFTSGELEHDISSELKVELVIAGIDKVSNILKEKYGRVYNFDVSEDDADSVKLNICINKNNFKYPVDALYDFINDGFKKGRISHIEHIMSLKNEIEFKTTFEIMKMSS